MVELLLDISKCYEHVVHAVLQDKAIARDYPLCLLRVSIASYVWQRVIVLEKRVAAVPVLPCRGIIAGNAMATTELTLYTLDGIRSVRRAEPTSTAATQVDDISLTVVVDRLEQLGPALERAASHSFHEFEVVLDEAEHVFLRRAQLRRYYLVEPVWNFHAPSHLDAVVELGQFRY